MSGFGETSLTITANNVVYRGTPVSVSGSISSAVIEITLNGTFNLTGSAGDVENGVYTNQTGTMTLGSIITVTPVGGSELSESSFLPTNAITLNFDGTLDFNDNNLTITDTSKVTVNYDSDNSGSVDTELKIYSQGNNSYISTKAVSGTITDIDNVSTTSDTTAPDITSSSSYSVVEGTTAIATLTANAVSYTHLTLPTMYTV